MTCTDILLWNTTRMQECAEYSIRDAKSVHRTDRLDDLSANIALYFCFYFLYDRQQAHGIVYDSAIARSPY